MTNHPYRLIGVYQISVCLLTWGGFGVQWGPQPLNPILLTPHWGPQNPGGVKP